MPNVVVVCDNAPVHASFFKWNKKFQGAEWLRLAPNSASLNPIEECWSVYDYEIRNKLLTYRLKSNIHLEHVIDTSIAKMNPTLRPVSTVTLK